MTIPVRTLSMELEKRQFAGTRSERVLRRRPQHGGLIVWAPIAAPRCATRADEAYVFDHPIVPRHELLGEFTRVRRPHLISEPLIKIHLTSTSRIKNPIRLATRSTAAYG
jgi:hypothetical protein